MSPLTPPVRAAPGFTGPSSHPTSPLLLPSTSLPTQTHAFPGVTSNNHHTNGHSGPIGDTHTGGTYTNPPTPEPASYGRPVPANSQQNPFNAINTEGNSQQILNMSNAPTSQLAWLASLTTSFADFTDEQKFQRKVCLLICYCCVMGQSGHRCRPETGR